MSDTDKAIKWAGEYLQKTGYLIQNLFEPVRLMPWSQVYRILTSQGYIYLKKMPSVFSLESKILFYLLDHNFEPLPHIIAQEELLNCFMMQNAGVVLRNILQKSYRTELVEVVFQKYVSIQKKSINHVENLLTLGVLDWRLSKFPAMYQALCHNIESFSGKGLQDTEIFTMTRLYPYFINLCDQLSKYSIPETLEHGDFQDNNVLAYLGQVTINYWGDCVICHPFFSLASYLDSVERHHMSLKNPLYRQLEDIYLKQWQEFESEIQLKKCLQLVRKLYPIKFATAFFRVQSNVNTDLIKKYKSKTIFNNYRNYMINGIKSFIQDSNKILK